MKKLLPLVLLVLSPHAFSCVTAGQNIACNGDQVFKGDTYSKGATVISENRYSSTVTVRSNSSGKSYNEYVQDLDMTNVSLDAHRTNDKVFKGDSYSQGAVVVGVNLVKRSVTVRSVLSGNLFVETPESLDVTRGCLSEICAGSRALKVNNRGSSVSREYIVLGINSFNYTATIQTPGTLIMDVVSIYDLRSANDSRDPQYPRDPQPRDPRDPQPREPRDPRPPRQPNPPAPAPVRITAQCISDRLDPSGLLVASYTGYASGYSHQDVKALACDDAHRQCNSDLRGRQTCRTSR